MPDHPFLTTDLGVLTRRAALPSPARRGLSLNVPIEAEATAVAVRVQAAAGLDIPGPPAGSGRTGGMPWYLAQILGQLPSAPACTGPLGWRGPAAADAGDLLAALDAAGVDPGRGFTSAAAPGTVASLIPNRYYPSEQEYLDAIADALRPEYERITAAGLLLQLDEHAVTVPAAAGSGSAATRIRWRIGALNRATAGIDPQRMRLHLWYGDRPGPPVPACHAITGALPALLAARPVGLYLPMTRPDHDQAWAVLATATVPAGKYLIAGVVDAVSRQVEDQQLVARRLARAAALAGPAAVVAGTGAGYSPFATIAPQPRRVADRKLQALTARAALAARQLQPVAAST